MTRLPPTRLGQAWRRTLLASNPSSHLNQPPHRGQSVNHALLDNGAYPIGMPCVCRVSANAVPIQDELSIRDQPLQQVDTILAELQDKITQSKRNTTLLNAQQNQTQSAL